MYLSINKTFCNNNLKFFLFIDQTIYLVINQSNFLSIYQAFFYVY